MMTISMTATDENLHALLGAFRDDGRISPSELYTVAQESDRIIRELRDKFQEPGLDTLFNHKKGIINACETLLEPASHLPSSERQFMVRALEYQVAHIAAAFQHYLQRLAKA